MEYLKAKTIKLLADYYENDFRRINHALSVLDETEILIKRENSLNYDEEISIVCALLHDVGIKQSEKDLGYNNGNTQEKYGPVIAEKLLNKIDFPKDKIKKVKEIIGNHHSKSRYDYIELELLKKADKIVNKNEGRDYTSI